MKRPKPVNKRPTSREKLHQVGLLNYCPPEIHKKSTGLFPIQILEHVSPRGGNPVDGLLTRAENAAILALSLSSVIPSASWDKSVVVRGSLDMIDGQPVLLVEVWRDAVNEGYPLRDDISPVERRRLVVKSCDPSRCQDKGEDI